MKTKNNILILFLIAFICLLKGQDTTGYPVSFSDTNAFNPSFRAVLNKLVLPNYNNTSLIVPHRSICNQGCPKCTTRCELITARIINFK